MSRMIEIPKAPEIKVAPNANSTLAPPLRAAKKDVKQSSNTQSPLAVLIAVSSENTPKPPTTKTSRGIRGATTIGHSRESSALMLERPGGVPSADHRPRISE